MKTHSIYKSSDGEQAIRDFYDSLIQDWPLPYESLNIKTSYGKTFVIKSGNYNAPPLILLHGANSNSGMWMSDIPEYASKYCIYAIDILGEPGGSDTTRIPLKKEDYYIWLTEILYQLNLSKISIIGYSFGGWIALNLSIHNPYIIDNLILIAPCGITSIRYSFFLRVAPFLVNEKLAINRMLKLSFRDLEVPKTIDTFTPLLLKYFSPRFPNFPIFSDDELKKLPFSTFILLGGKDPLIHSKNLRTRILSLTPSTQIEILPEYGHIFLNITPKILSFLQIKNKTTP